MPEKVDFSTLYAYVEDMDDGELDQFSGLVKFVATLSLELNEDTFTVYLWVIGRCVDLILEGSISIGGVTKVAVVKSTTSVCFVGKWVLLHV